MFGEEINIDEKWLKQFIKDYIKENLTVKVEDNTDYYSDFNEKIVTISLDGEEVCWDKA